MTPYKPLQFLLFLGISFCYFPSSLAQYTPPGLGEVHTAEWFALGIKEDINTSKKINSTTFLGVGRSSSPDNYTPFNRAAIYVFNQEVSFTAHKHWQYAGALSYRWQNRYTKETPYTLDNPSGRQEIRVYGKYAYKTAWQFVDISFTLRPELRLFFNPDFSAYASPKSYRMRFSNKFKFHLNRYKTKNIQLKTELLGTVFNENAPLFTYTETRFSLYYSTQLYHNSAIFNIGYMNDLINGPHITDAHYIALDVTFKNLFTHKAHQPS